MQAGGTWSEGPLVVDGDLYFVGWISTRCRSGTEKRQRGENSEREIAFAIAFPANSLKPRQLCTFADLPRTPQVFVRSAFFELAAIFSWRARDPLFLFPAF